MNIIVSVVMHVVLLIACICIVAKIIVRWSSDIYFGKDYSLWDADMFVIRPRWPFLVACTSLYFFFTNNEAMEITAFLALSVLFWILIWFKAIREYEPLSTVDLFDYENAEEYPDGKALS